MKPLSAAALHLLIVGHSNHSSTCTLQSRVLRLGEFRRPAGGFGQRRLHVYGVGCGETSSGHAISCA
ncbi:hypothetical protein SLE2022_188180 [Rubroshorea leprosula]